MLIPRESEFYPRLEALRGMAAVCVAAMHAAHPPDLPVSDLLSRAVAIILNGQGAVNFFFVLSGFVLSASLASTASTGFARFAGRRLLRLLPAIWISLAILIPVYAHLKAGALVPSNLSARRIVENLLLVDTSLNGLMWSIQVEAVAIPLVYLLHRLKLAIGGSALIISAAILFALSFDNRWAAGFGYGVSLTPLLAFALGMIVYRYRPHYSSTMTWCLLVISAALFCLPRLFLGTSASDYRWITILESIASASLISIVICESRLKMAAFLDRTIPRFYGRISYSLYLLHPLALVALFNRFPYRSLYEGGMPATAVSALLVLLTFAMTTPVAWLTWKLIERPGIRLGRAMG